MTNKNAPQNLAGFFWTWLALTVVGVALGLWAPSYIMPASMSQNMHLSILTVVIFSVAAAPVAAGVYAATIFILRHFTYRGETPPPAGPAVRENPVLLISWVVASVVLTVFLLVWGLGALAVDDSSAAKPLVVNVTGQQWLWTFEYPGTHVQSHTLYLPKGREVEFHVTHGFWIANMGIQVDANEGVTTSIHTTPNKLGVFDIRCTQFCGLNHAYMVTQGRVVTPAQFSHWLASNSHGS
jgi:cytochrome c oxidase subunit 2